MQTGWRGRSGVWVLGLLVAGFGVAAAWAVLPGYYGDPVARDNYKGVAAYLAAAGDPARDLVVLAAPGQQEVWRYYDPGLPVLALPQQRPPDVAATEAALAAALADRQRVYALFWALDEADPAGIVEGWLGRHWFKRMESWQGNLRLAIYDALPQALTCEESMASFGPSVRLEAVCLPPAGQVIAAGEPVLIQLRWRAAEPIQARYKTTLQLLDGRNQVIAQQDMEPAGGSRPTDGWLPGELIDDNHGLPTPYGMAPGVYRLILAMYDPATGQRLAVGDENGADFLELGLVTMQRAAQPLPDNLLPIRRRQVAALGPVTFLGYDQVKRGFAHAPETALTPGDQAHFTFYWRAPDPLPTAWPADLSFTLTLGDQTLTAPLAGGAYPTGSWQAGEVVRGEFDIPYDGSDARATLAVGGATIELAPLPTLP